MNVDLEIDHQPLRSAFARALRFEVGLLRTRALDVFEGRYDIEQTGEQRSEQRGEQRGEQRSEAPGKPRGRDKARVIAPHTRLRYTATIVLRVPPPPAVGSAAVRQNLAAQLQAVAQEVARRSAA
jgi:hypothetical protein